MDDDDFTTDEGKRKKNIRDEETTFGKSKETLKALA